LKTKGKRACPVCGALFTDSESCPVCALRGALGNKQSASESPTEPTLSPSQLRLEHYEILTREDGAPFELGRGAMGVTYKAVDINLRCAVALKVINTRWIGDELARRRFVREARAAASVRHPNVASVFHLGKRGDSYFYAMEFVEGETLQSLIKRSGRLDVNLAPEIATQVVAGLAAVHKQKLIHRDLKPSNIMVSLEDGGAVAAKIIDLGLAKAVKESASDAEISTGGAFAGTPEFASPEQFAGVGADIRSDLYSLGVVLWEMLTGKVPFNGSVAEVMYQHVHKSAPVELLKDIPQPVIVLEALALSLRDNRQFRAAEQTYARLIELLPNQPMLELQVAEVSFRETGDDTAAWSALAALPASLTDERDVVFSRLRYAFIDRNWTQAKELIDKMKGAESNIFAYVVVPVPIGCYYILLARLQGEQSGEDPSFAQTRTALKQKVQKSPANALLLSNLAVVDALLGHKDASIVEAKRAVEMLPISKDAVLAPRLLLNLAVVYAWTNELDLAFENLAALTKTPGGIFYGWLKCDPYWDPLRADPRYEKLLAELAPQD
jgi:serine/threonine protein kinase